MKRPLTGIFAPLTTPFSSDYMVSYRYLRENIEKYEDFPLSGYVILGTSGEAVYLSDRESEKIMKAAAETVSGNKLIIAGTARESTGMTIEFTNHMAEYGADAAMIRTPTYFRSRLDSNAIKRHFLSIADRSRIPIILYNIPQQTGITLTAELIADLSRHPHIIGLKDSTGDLDLLKSTLTRTKNDFHILVGAGSILLSGLIMGARGGITILADIVPGLCCRLYSLYLDKKMEEAASLQQDLILLNRAATETYGISGAKFAMDIQGYNGGPCRPPLPLLKEEDKSCLRNILSALDAGHQIKSLPEQK